MNSGGEPASPTPDDAHARVMDQMYGNKKKKKTPKPKKAHHHHMPHMHMPHLFKHSKTDLPPDEAAFRSAQALARLFRQSKEAAGWRGHKRRPHALPLFPKMVPVVRDEAGSAPEGLDDSLPPWEPVADPVVAVHRKEGGDAHKAHGHGHHMPHIPHMHLSFRHGHKDKNSDSDPEHGYILAPP